MVYLIIRRVFESAKIERVGVGVYGAETDVKPNSSAVYVWNAILGSAGVFTGLIAVLVVAMIESMILSIEAVSIGDPDTIWHLLTVERDPDGLGGEEFLVVSWIR